MYSINSEKELAQPRRPLLLARFVFPDGAALHVSTIPCTFGGVEYFARIDEQEIERLASLSEQGVDRVAAVSVRLADPDSWVWDNYERHATRGFKGANLTLTFALYDPTTGEFSTDSFAPFVGLCDQPSKDAKHLTVAATSKLNLTKINLPTVPLQVRCSWINPSTAAQRIEAADPASRFYRCGETRDLATAPPCAYTKQTCTQLSRYGGCTYQFEKTGSGRQYVSGQRIAWANADTSGKGKEYWPLWLGGKAWITATVINQAGDGNYTRGEAAVGIGSVVVEKVLVNNIELTYSAGMTGDYRWHYVNDGSRDGTPNPDAMYDGNGDPYGNCTVIQWLADQQIVPPDGNHTIRILGRRKDFASYKHIASASATGGGIITVTLEGPNEDINDGTTVTIEGCGFAAANGTWPAINGAWGPPGTFQLQGSSGDGSGTGGIVRYNSTGTYGGGGAPTSLVLGETLRWCRLHESDLDLDSFADTAAICNAPISYTDNEGNPQTQPRFTSAVALKEKRNAAELVRGIRQSIGGLLTPGPDGKIRLQIEGPLCEQQPAAVDGSNYNVAIPSTTRAGVAANGYIAYRFDDSNSWDVKRIARPLSESPNRVSFTFSDPANDWAISPFSVADPHDIARTEQETPGGLQVEPDAIASHNHAYRCAMLGLNKIHRGNPQGDTRGTDWWEWQTSFRGCKLQIGQIVFHAGLPNQYVRLTEIKPDRNYEKVTLRGHYHSDAWYSDTPAGLQDPGLVKQPYDPAEAVALGDVQPIGGAPFVLSKTEDGMNAVLDGEYDPPATIGSFVGIVAHVEDPNGARVVSLANSYDYDGDPAAAAGSAARRGHFRLVYPQPVAAGSTIRVYLTSRSQTYVKPVVFAGDAGESPSVTVQLSQATPPLDAPDPLGPSACTVATIESGDNFGLRTSWTPADPYGGTIGYEREARYYSDSAAATPISTWIPLGALYGAANNTADQGFWPKPTTTTYVRLRVRAYNADGDVTAWVESSTPLPQVPVSQGSSVPAPAAPTSPTITVLDQTGNFGLRTAWTAPGDLGSTVGYDREVQYYSDSGAVTSLSDWIPLGAVGIDVVTADSGWWPRPKATQYVRLRVRGFNGLDAKSTWVLSGTPLPAVAPFATPPQPATNTSTLETGVIGGVPSFRFHLVATGAGGTTDGFLAQARFYSDAGATPISDWIPLGWLDPASPQCDTDWWPLSDVQVYAKVRIAAQNADNGLSPWLETAVLTRPASTGIQLTSVDSSTVGSGLTKTAAGMALGTDNLASLTMNPDFKDGLAHWPALPGGLTAKPLATGGRTSPQCLQFTTALQSVYQEVASCQPGNSFYLEIWSKTVQAFTHRLYYFIRFFDGAGATLPGESWDVLTSRNVISDWVKSTQTETAPAGAAKAVVALIADEDLVSGEILVDNIYMAKVATADEVLLTGGLVPKNGGIALDEDGDVLLDAVGHPVIKQGVVDSNNLSAGALGADLAKYSASKHPVGIYFGLPLVSDAQAPNVIFNTYDGKLYRRSGGVWSKAQDPADVITGFLASGVTVTGIVYAHKIIEQGGGISGCRLTLNLNGVTASIANQYDAVYGGYAGLCVQLNGSNHRALVSYNGFAVVNPSGLRSAELSSDYFRLGADANPQIQMFGSTGSMYIREISLRNNNNVGTGTLFGSSGIAVLNQFRAQNAQWNYKPLWLGSFVLWVDASSRLRIKFGEPTFDTDGVVVGAQS